MHSFPLFRLVHCFILPGLDTGYLCAGRFNLGSSKCEGTLVDIGFRQSSGCQKQTDGDHQRQIKE